MDGVQVRINPQRGAHVGVAHLSARLNHVHPGQIQQRAEGVPEPVHGDVRNRPVQPLGSRLAGPPPFQVRRGPGPVFLVQKPHIGAPQLLPGGIRHDAAVGAGNHQQVVPGQLRHVVRQPLGNIHRPHTSGGLCDMTKAGDAAGIVLHHLVDGDGPGLQVHVRPGQRRQLPPPEPGQHHNHCHTLGPVGCVPNPLLFFGS